MIGVYKIVFPDGQFYIGSAYGKKGFEGRWEKHRKGDKSSPKYLQELVKSYGGWSCAVFLILRETKTEQRALLCEQAYINRNKNNSLLLNHNKNVLKAPDMSGENHPMFGKHLSEETKKKMSENHADFSGENHPMFGRHQSEETKKKISNATKGENHPNFGKHRSEKTKRKISEAKKGENHPMFGKHLSEETKGKMSEAKRGEDNHSAKLTWIQVREIRYKYNIEKTAQKQLAEEYEVQTPAIWKIINYKTWKEETK
jgi:group I intron endonuclease